MTVVPGFVLDASVTMAWCLDDQNVLANSALESLENSGAIAPSIWPLEVSNALVVAERRGYLNRMESTYFLTLLRSLPVLVEMATEDRVFSDILNLAREQMLSTYDAAYLELAMRTGLPLATLDEALRKAAQRCGVALMV